MSQNNARWLLQQGRIQLAQAGIEEGALESRILLEYLLGVSREQLLLREMDPVTPEVEERFFTLLAHRKDHMPLQYLVENAWFWGRPFYVSEAVLIPRPDTEILVEAALQFHQEEPVRVMADICTGSGCIPITLALEGVGFCYGTDISEAALSVARKNTKNLGPEKQTAFLAGDLCTALQGKEPMDLITANPPYIPTDEVAKLLPEVRDYEPQLALDGGQDGLDFYRRLIPQSRTYLRPKGALMMEIGTSQAAAVKEEMERSGFRQVKVLQDLAGRDRVVIGRIECDAG